jgi:hypothetical protein
MALPTKAGTAVTVRGTYPDPEPEPELGSSLFGEDDWVQRLRLSEQRCTCDKTKEESYCEDCRHDVCGKECRVCGGDAVNGCGLYCGDRYDE